MATVQVNEVVGTVWLVNADGSRTQVQQGMQIADNAKIITENGAQVVLSTDEGLPLTVAEGRELALSPDVFDMDVDAWGSVITDEAETATSALDAEAARVIAALAEGADPFELLDATAATAAAATAGGPGSDGSSFTRLLSIVETTTPLALAYPRTGVEFDPQILGGTAPAGAGLLPEGEDSVAPGDSVEPGTPVVPSIPVLPEAELEPEVIETPEAPEEFTPAPPRVYLSINDPLVSEGDEAVFTIGISRPLNVESTLTLQLKPGTAGFDDLWEDGNPEGKEITVVVGDDSQQVTVDAEGKFTVQVPPQTTEVKVYVPTYNDTIFEGEESFTLEATLTDTGMNSPSTEGTGTIVDDGTGPGDNPDDDRPVITVADAGRVSEGDPATFVVEIVGEVKEPQEVVLELDFLVDGNSSNTASGNDIDASTVSVSYEDENGDTQTLDIIDGKITVPAGVTKVEVTVPTLTDSDEEEIESFQLQVTEVGDVTQTEGPVTGDAEIVDLPTLEVQQAEISEGAQQHIEGEVTLRTPAGVSSIVIGGVTVAELNAAGDLEFTAHSFDMSDLGQLTITGFDENTGKLTYEYKVSGKGQDHTGDKKVFDNFKITVTDTLGAYVEGGLLVEITDVGVEAENDAFEQTAENAVIEGDVLANDTFGVDGKADGTGKVTLVEGSLTGKGELTLNADGTFAYKPADSERDEASIQFEYTMTDGDGDTDTATVTITLQKDSKPTIAITPNDAESTVKESGLTGGTTEGEGHTTSGTLNITTVGDELAKVEINGEDVTGGGTVTTDKGELKVSVDENGVYSYEYTLTSSTTKEKNDKDEFVVQITDSDGDKADATLTIDIVDDKPVAANDSGHVKEDGTPEELVAEGNVLDNDKIGADGHRDENAKVDWSATENDAVRYEIGKYGTLELDEKGNWKFTLDNTLDIVQKLGENDKPSFDFKYTITDGDGDTAEAILTITIEGTNDAPEIKTETIDGVEGAAFVKLSESGLKDGIQDDGHTTHEKTVTGNIEFTDKDANDTLTVTLSKPEDTIKSNGNDVIWDLSNGGKTLEGKVGDQLVMKVTIDDEGEYKVELHAPVDHGVPGSENNQGLDDLLSLNIGVNVSDGKVTTSSTIVVTIEDDAPVAQEKYDAGIVKEDDVDQNSVSGNIFRDSEGKPLPSVGFGADGGSLVWDAPIDLSDQSAIDLSKYGTLEQDLDTGEWSFTLDNTKEATQALGENESIKVSIPYTLTDKDGDTATSTVKFVIQGTNDAPVIAKGQSGTVIEAGVIKDTNTDTPGNESTSGDLLSDASDIDNDDEVSFNSIVAATGTVIKSSSTNSETGVITLVTNHGTLTVQPNGEYKYVIDNTADAVDRLAVGQSATDIFEFTVKDTEDAVSEPQQLTITIQGTNDRPEIMSSVTNFDNLRGYDGFDSNEHTSNTVAGLGMVVEKGESNKNNYNEGKASGTLEFSDVDSDGLQEWRWNWIDQDGNEVTGVTLNGTYGTMELVNTNPDNPHDPDTWKWEYTLQNEWQDTQALGDGDKKTESFTVRITDKWGASHDKVILVGVEGTNDLPEVLGGGSTLGVREDAKKTDGELFYVNKDEAEENGGIWNPEGKLEITEFTIGDTKYTQSDLGGKGVDIPGMGTLILYENGKYEFKPAKDFSGKLPVIEYTAQETSKDTGEDNSVFETVSSTLEITVTPVADKPVFEEATPESGYEDLGVDHADGKHSAISLGLGLPEVTDNERAGNAAEGDDHPERLGAISITGLKAGDVLEIDGGGTITAYTDGKGKLRYKYEDSDGVEHNPSSSLKVAIIGTQSLPEDAAEMKGVIWLSEDDYKSLALNPKAHDGTNRKITASVKSYEVDEHGNRQVYQEGHVDSKGNPISEDLLGTPIPGSSTAKQTVDIDIKAVTDPVYLNIVKDGEDGGNWTGDGYEITSVISVGENDDKYDSATITLEEDKGFKLNDILKAAFDDLDGSENRWIVISGLPEDAFVNGAKVGKTGEVTIHAQGQTGDITSFPEITIKPSKDFSGVMDLVTVTLNAKDSDEDSYEDSDESGISTETAKVELNFEVTPVIDGLELVGTEGNEDSFISFLENVKFGDIDGSEKLTAFGVTIQEGWTLYDGEGELLSPEGEFDLYEYADGKDLLVDGKLTQAGLQALADNLKLLPPEHSSTDIDLELSYTIVEDLAESEAKEFTDTIRIEVNPVAEVVTNNEEGDDLIMTKGHEYGSEITGEEDKGFALSVKDKDGDYIFDLGDHWENKDTSEKTFAILNPYLVEGRDADKEGLTQVSITVNGVEQDAWIAKGSYFTYGDGMKAEFNSDVGGYQIPMEYLDTVEFHAPKDTAGRFDIKVQAHTQDFDEDRDDQNDADRTPDSTATSGEAWLEGIIIKPVADEVANLRTDPVYGKEDEPIALDIRPSSTDKSETFNVKIGDIPAGATITYTDKGGKEVTYTNDTGGLDVLVIEGFDSNTKPSITAPKDSNENIELKVQAQTVDTWHRDGEDEPYTSESKWSPATPQDLVVNVKGVADGAVVEMATEVTFMENKDLDEENREISLKDLVNNVTSKDIDTSESHTYRVNGLPEGFTVVGATLLGGSGEERIWLFNDLDNVSIKVPENFSGKLPGSFGVVSTENDGDFTKFLDPESEESTEWVEFDAFVNAELDSTLSGSTSIKEDSLTSIDFVAGFNTNGDSSETLTAVLLSQNDIDRLRNEGLLIYINGEELTSDKYEDGYYQLGSDDTVTAKNSTEHKAHGDDGAALSFEFKDIKYVVEQTHDNGDVVSETLEGSGTHTITIEAVSDQSTLGVDKNELDLTGDNKTGNLALTITNPDQDGSESLTHVRFSGVPSGLILGEINGRMPVMIGKGEWVYYMPQGTTFDQDAILQNVQITAGSYLTNGDHKITIVSTSKDLGAESSINSESQEVIISSDRQGTGGGPDEEFVITLGTKELEGGVEDEAFSLGDLITAQMTLGNDPADATFSLVIDVAPGATLKLPEGFDDENYYLKVYPQGDQWVVVGKSSDDLVKALEEVEVQPPLNWNSKKDGPLSLDVKLNAYLDDGRAESSETLSPTVDLTPVTDELDVGVSFENAEEGKEIGINITLENTRDSDNTVHSVKVKLTGEYVGGDLSYSKGDITGPDDEGFYTITFDEPITVTQDGDETLSGLTYTPTGDQQFSGGQKFGVEVIVTNKEGNSETIESGGKGEVKVAVVNNGFEADVTATGDEVGVVESKGELKDSAITLDLGKNAGLKDSDEIIHSAMISGLPEGEGFLVYVGTGDDATLALNAGDGTSWLIPVNGKELPEISILPPQHWSGTLPKVTLDVNSGEDDGREASTNSFEFDLSAKAVVDGVHSMHADTAFGKEGEAIGLNLNLTLKDGKYVSATDATVERATVMLTGLGANAAFYVGDLFIQGSYDAATDTYVLAGLSQTAANNLKVRQAAQTIKDLDREGMVDVIVTTQEYDRQGNPVGEVSLDNAAGGSFTIVIEPQEANDENNDLLYFGEELDGKGGYDTVYLRPGETLNLLDAVDDEGNTVAGHFKNIEAIDLSRDGHNNTINGLGQVALDTMFKGSDTPSLTIIANEGDAINFVKDEGWTVVEDEKYTNEGAVTYKSTKTTTGDDDQEVTKDYFVRVEKPAVEEPKSEPENPEENEGVVEGDDLFDGEPGLLPEMDEEIFDDYLSQFESEDDGEVESESGWTKPEAVDSEIIESSEEPLPSLDDVLLDEDELDALGEEKPAEVVKSNNDAPTVTIDVDNSSVAEDFFNKPTVSPELGG